MPVWKTIFDGKFFKTLIKRYTRIQSSIYGQVVYVITFLSLFLFISFGVIFWSVNERYMKNVIYQSGNNIGVLVEGALYYSMLENDKKTLQNTLDIINTLSGIDEVNMYDKNDSLVYWSFITDTSRHSNPDCRSCHTDLGQMFPRNKKAYRILDERSNCLMNKTEEAKRQLLLKSPILNERTCYESACHFHGKDDDVLGYLIIKVPLENLDATLTRASTDFFFLASLTTVFLVVFLIIFTRKNIKDPLHQIIKASESVTSGDRTTRLTIKPNQLHDIRLVSIAFNQMLDSLMAVTRELENWSQQLEYKIQKKTEELGEVQNELINIERIASLGRLSLSVAHEINNPLSGILVYTKLIQKQLSNPELDDNKKVSIMKNLSLIENETKRCGDIVKSLLDFSRKDQETLETVDLHEILRETGDLMSHPMKIANIHFYTDFSAERDRILCSPNQIKQACIAMLVNASEAVRDNGEVYLRTSNPDENYVKIEIADNGIGIPEEDIPHIFEPFFSTKHNSSGTGLGLAIVHGIIQRHKGKIEVRSKPGAGTSIGITLPLIKA